MAFGNATKGYVRAHSGGGGTGTDNYNNLSNKPKINGVALSGNKTSADLHIETGTDDYEDLTNKPSINGVELLGENVIGLLSGNIQVDYTKLTDLPSINGVTLSGNKTSADLHISGSGTTDYEDLTNKPSINGVELLGDKEVGLLSGNIHVDYSKLTNLPSINGVELSGNKTSSDLHISGYSETVLYDEWNTFAEQSTITLSDDFDKYDELIIYTAYHETGVGNYYTHFANTSLRKEILQQSYNVSPQGGMHGLFDFMSSPANVPDVQMSWSARMDTKKQIYSYQKHVGDWTIDQCGIYKIVGIKY